MDKTNIEHVGLLIADEYSNFPDFIKAEKRQICYKMLELFEEMISNDKEKKFIVNATVNGIIFDTEYDINTENTYLLTVINDYFEGVEEYEMCARIQKLQLKLII